MAPGDRPQRQRSFELHLRLEQQTQHNDNRTDRGRRLHRNDGNSHGSPSDPQQYIPGLWSGALPAPHLTLGAAKETRHNDFHLKHLSLDRSGYRIGHLRLYHRNIRTVAAMFLGSGCNRDLRCILHNHHTSRHSDFSRSSGTSGNQD